MQEPIKTELSVGELSSRSGVSISALHFYEKEGLIPAFRTEGNQRRYPRGILRRVAVIKVAQGLGISLKEIKEAFESLPKNKAPSAKDWRDLSKKWKKDLNRRIKKMEDLRDELNNCIACGCLSMSECPLRNPGDKFGKKKSGPGLI